MKDIRVSVLVTFYNQESYVDKALNSIINQKTEFGVKIIVGDDGSSDDTCLLVEKWIKKYPNNISLHRIRRDSNYYIPGFRASKNRLNLLDFVDTEFFIFLDGDDYFDYDEKLQKQVDILDNDNNKDCICCGHNIDILYPDGKRIPMESSNLKEGKIYPKEYWKKYYFHTDTILARSEIIKKIDKSLLENNFNDNLITFSIIQNGKIYYIPESWCVYLQTGDGVWTSGKRIENQIRNMYGYDICNMINRRFKRETSIRFSHAWYDLYCNRNLINSSELLLFLKEAEEKNLRNSIYWINYNNMSKVIRFLFLIRVYIMCKLYL